MGPLCQQFCIGVSFLSFWCIAHAELGTDIWVTCGDCRGEHDAVAHHTGSAGMEIEGQPSASYVPPLAKHCCDIIFSLTLSRSVDCAKNSRVLWPCHLTGSTQQSKQRRRLRQPLRPTKQWWCRTSSRFLVATISPTRSSRPTTTTSPTPTVPACSAPSSQHGPARRPLDPTGYPARALLLSSSKRGLWWTIRRKGLGVRSAQLDLISLNRRIR